MSLQAVREAKRIRRESAAGLRCEACDEWREDMLEGHHIVPRRMGGTDVPENVMILCHICHKRVHRNLGGLFGPRERSKILGALHRMIAIEDEIGFSRMMDATKRARPGRLAAEVP